MSQEIEYNLPAVDAYREQSPMSDVSDRTERPRVYDSPPSPLTPPETPRSRHTELTDDDADTIASSPFPTTPRTPAARPHTAGARRASLKPLAFGAPPLTPSSSQSTAASGPPLPAEAYAEYFGILAKTERERYRDAQALGYGLFPGATPPSSPAGTPLKAAAARRQGLREWIGDAAEEPEEPEESNSDSGSEDECAGGEAQEVLYAAHPRLPRSPYPFRAAAPAPEPEESLAAVLGAAIPHMLTLTPPRNNAATRNAAGSAARRSLGTAAEKALRRWAQVRAAAGSARRWLRVVAKARPRLRDLDG
ncbi:hypothetical protein PsYK624_074190 [Phanerochaete sordida]|uniref:Uncharacterized protein n=1 Tax=Phanerochaete sordida TaxID=48140 RepID=A0A9P3LDH7_9APHY|nr:hypothetical protein PsYK624_074190 [Phanerochaete sordida]